MRHENSKNWLNLKHDPTTGVETLHAHFEGHAYDSHWHETYVIGLTESGVQQFDCRHKTHNSLQGECFLLEPGEVHNGRAPCEGGFTYRTLYIPQDWLHTQISSLYEHKPDQFELSFNNTLCADKGLASATSSAFLSKHLDDPKIVQEGCFDHMVHALTQHLNWRQKNRRKTAIISLIASGIIFMTIWKKISSYRMWHVNLVMTVSRSIGLLEMHFTYRPMSI